MIVGSHCDREYLSNDISTVNFTESCFNPFPLFCLIQFFPDKAATRELNALSVSCPNEGCQWEGLYKEYFETHLGVCPQARIKCPFDMCTEHVIRKNLDRHTKKCGFRPEQCQFCGRDCRANQIDVSSRVLYCS